MCHVCIKGGPLSAPVVLVGVLVGVLVVAAEALVTSARLEQGAEGQGRAAIGSTSWGVLWSQFTFYLAIHFANHL